MIERRRNIFAVSDDKDWVGYMAPRWHMGLDILSFSEVFTAQDSRGWGYNAFPRLTQLKIINIDSSVTCFIPRSRTNIFPCVFDLSSSNWGELFSQSEKRPPKTIFLFFGAELVEIIFLIPKSSNFAAKYFIKLLHPGSSHDNSLLMFRSFSDVFLSFLKC